ncbi:MAG: hypothetical protein ACK4YF_05715, partial [Exilispira sp.]
IRREPFNKFNSISNLRLTIDTYKDYQTACNIIKNYEKKKKEIYLIDLDDIEKIYKKKKYELEINIDEIQKSYND